MISLLDVEKEKKTTEGDIMKWYYFNLLIDLIIVSRNFATALNLTV